MSVVETDFLKELLDPEDRIHSHCLEALKRVKARKWHIASSAFLELDLLLKSFRVSMEDRMAIFQALRSEIPGEVVLTISHEAMSHALSLQKKYYKIGRFYFDSLHLALAILLDGKIVSSDRTFDEVEEVERIPLEEL